MMSSVILKNKLLEKSVHIFLVEFKQTMSSLISVHQFSLNHKQTDFNQQSVRDVVASESYRAPVNALCVYQSNLTRGGSEGQVQ